MLGIRLSLARAMIGLWQKAYDALLHYGVNMKALPEYEDDSLLEEADKLVILEGRGRYLLWIERVTHAIDAAVRRKQFRLVNKPPTTDTTKE